MNMTDEAVVRDGLGVECSVAAAETPTVVPFGQDV
jgi:hypothetical protein